jgi:hypothetical protein
MAISAKLCLNRTDLLGLFQLFFKFLTMKVCVND